MAMEDNKALVLEFYKGFDDRRMEDSMNLLAPDFKGYMAGLPEALDSEGFRQFGMTFYVAFSQGQHIFDEVILAGDKKDWVARIGLCHEWHILFLGIIERHRLPKYP